METDDELRELLTRGARLRFDRNFTEAAEVFRRALERAETLYGSEAMEVANPLCRLADVVASPSDFDPSHLAEAVELRRRALRIAEHHLGMDNPQLIGLLHNFELDLQMLGRNEEARESIVRALHLSEGAQGDGGYTDFLLRDLTNVLLDMNRPAEALPFARRLLHIEERRTDDPPLMTLALATRALGRCLMDLGQAEEAIACFERTFAVLKARYPNQKTMLDDELHSWLEALRKGS